MQSFLNNKEDDWKFQVQLMNAMVDKQIMCNPNIVKHAKNIDLTDVFKDLFKKEEPKEQSIEEIVKNMRARM